MSSWPLTVFWLLKRCKSLVLCLLIILKPLSAQALERSWLVKQWWTNMNSCLNIKVMENQPNCHQAVLLFWTNPHWLIKRVICTCKKNLVCFCWGIQTLNRKVSSKQCLIQDNAEAMYPKPPLHYLCDPLAIQAAVLYGLCSTSQFATSPTLSEFGPKYWPDIPCPAPLATTVTLQHALQPLSIISQMKAILIILPPERNCWSLLNIVMHPSWKDLPVCYTCSVHAQMAKLTFMVNMDAMWLPRWPFNELTTTIFFGNKLDSRVSHL